MQDNFRTRHKCDAFETFDQGLRFDEEYFFRYVKMIPEPLDYIVIPVENSVK